LVLFVSFVENSKIQTLTNLIKTTSDNYKKQFDAMQELNNKRLEEDKKIIETYEERIQQIEKKRAADLAKVNAKKIQVVDELKNKSTEELAQKMKDEFKL
jgi:23S rRNA pseudoU1915 N3-methylase RlmH